MTTDTADVTTVKAFEALDDLCQENEDLRAENLLLKAQLELARTKLHTAEAFTVRRGW